MACATAQHLWDEALGRGEPGVAVRQDHYAGARDREPAANALKP